MFVTSSKLYSNYSIQTIDSQNKNLYQTNQCLLSNYFILTPEQNLSIFLPYRFCQEKQTFAILKGRQHPSQQIVISSSATSQPRTIQISCNLNQKLKGNPSSVSFQNIEHEILQVKNYEAFPSLPHPSTLHLT